MIEDVKLTLMGMCYCIVLWMQCWVLWGSLISGRYSLILIPSGKEHLHLFLSKKL